VKKISKRRGKMNCITCSVRSLTPFYSCFVKEYLRPVPKIKALLQYMTIINAIELFQRDTEVRYEK